MAAWPLYVYLSRSLRSGIILARRAGWNFISNEKHRILKQLQVVFRTGEFTGIFGPTGSGKTTLLLSMLNQFETTGEIRIDGISYHDYYQNHFKEVGFVPQDDVLFRDLTVNETLNFSIALRGLASKRDKIQTMIKQTLDKLHLNRTAKVLIGDENKKGISGGQRKRVNLALELLSENIYILMLDEPTSGLDPGTELQIHQLLRELTSQGLLILMVSHSLYEATMNTLDKALILTEEGEIAYYGPSMEARQYFQVDTPEEIFSVLEQHTSSYWAKKFQNPKNIYYRKYVLARLPLNRIKRSDETQSLPPQEQDTSSEEIMVQSRETKNKKEGYFRQFHISTQRLFYRQVRDRQSLLSKTMQSVLLALVLRLAYSVPESGLLSLLSIVPVWIGATVTVRAINSELPVFFREQRYGLAIFPYLFSVFVVNAFFVLVQIFIFLMILYRFMPLALFGFHFIDVLVIVYLTGLAGVSLGLLLSVLFTSQQASVNALPVFLVLMILFGGSAIPLN